MKVDTYTLRRMGIKGQADLYTHSPLGAVEGVCKMVGCGWHAELRADGFCSTRECREQRPRKVFRGRDQEQADLRTRLYLLTQELNELKAQKAMGTVAKVQGMRVIRSNLRT